MYAVIMAGGKGTRFWPKSRERMPKHLLDIAGEKTIIRQTVDRMRPIIPAANVLIVTGASHADELIRQLPDIPRENIIIEPVGKNTAPCIGLAAMTIRKKDPDAVMIVLPSDHMIAEEEKFLHIVGIAAEMAQQGDHLLTIGIEPTAPETGYGYIEQGKEVASIRGEHIYAVKSIREKPDIKKAKSFLKKGGFFWNSGMFVWKASAILDAIAKWLPDIYAGLKTIEPALGTANEDQTIDDVYHAMRGISIDYGVMEKAGNALVVRGDFGWSDIGSWDALWDISEKDEMGNVVKGRFIGVDVKNSLIHSHQKLVALVGVEDLLIVETDDALLICKRGASQNVKTVVEKLMEHKKTEYL
ncbi:MAG: mannose-1-phosphate guanylyltransferase [Deltaproteobacteria bacterium]|nr:mannose-1-phosphate guanylyltransferase [Deltaproteobacteria bacterium]